MPTASTTTHRVHVLISPSFGRGDGNRAKSLCGYPAGSRKNWPAGHLCVRLEPGGKLPVVVNCPDCILRYQERMK